MSNVWLRRLAVTLCSVLLLTGCEEFKEALLDEEGSGNPNSEDYQPKFVVGIFSIVDYPRALDLEQEITTMDGTTITINTNQNFGSKNLRDVQVIPRPGNPEICDLKFKLDRRGKVLWELMAGNHANEPVVLAVDSRHAATFIPELPADPDSKWVLLRVGIDHYTAKGIARYAKKNYLYYNPRTDSWFDGLL